jgi:beta-glucosidase
MKHPKNYLVRPALCSIACLLTACGGQTAFVGDNNRGLIADDSSTSDARAPTKHANASRDAGSSETPNDESDGGTSGTGGAVQDDTPAQSGDEPNATLVSEGPDAASEPKPDTSNLSQFSCEDVASQQFDSATMQAYALPADAADAADAALELMSEADLASQMVGVDGAAKDFQDLYRTPDVDVPGLGVLRGLNFRDASRGVNLDAGQRNRPSDGNDFATVFPTPALRAASWDLDLEKRVGAAIGDEVAASLNNVGLGPSADLVRHPYWGRALDAYGEDVYLTGRMATAFTVGMQQYVMACAEHFAGYNEEKYRTRFDATMNEQTLREIYTRQFGMIVQDAGIACVMTSNNKLNGVKTTQNQHLLRDILKAPRAEGGIGFEGFVISDWWAMPGDQAYPDAATAQAVADEAVQAGLDIELPWTMHYSTQTLAQADQELVADAARRVVTQKYRFESASANDGWSKTAPSSSLNGGSIAPNDDHEALAEEAAVDSMVLLSNGLNANSAILPLQDAHSIAVLGTLQQFSLISSNVPKSCITDGDSARQCTFHFATDPAFGDRGSNRVNGDPARSVGPFQGIAAAAGTGRVVTNGNSADAADDADTIVVVVGYTPGDEGEEYPVSGGGDRSSLDLPAEQLELVSSVLDLDKPTVIVIESGSIVNLPWLEHANKNQATIWAGYPGLRGGSALGRLIFGDANFSGKMPMAWPVESELPAFKDSESETQMGYSFGYREFDRRKYVDGTAVNLVFPFGHGLSYSTFDYANLSLPCETVTKDAVFDVSVEITNTSAVDGDEVAMLFVKPPPKPEGITGERPWKELASFARVAVAAGQTVTAQLPVRVQDLRRWEGDASGHWMIDSGQYTIVVGKNAEDAESATTLGTLTVEGD